MHLSSILKDTINKLWHTSLVSIQGLKVTFIGDDLLPNSLYTYRTVITVKSTSLPSKKQELSKAENELARLNDTCTELHQQVRLSRGQVEEARSALQAHRSRGQVLRALMEQKESGAIPGIHGRLVSELIHARFVV